MKTGSTVPAYHASRTTTPSSMRHTKNGVRAANPRNFEEIAEVRILDPAVAQEIIRQRQESGIDKHDEVWDGVYIVSPQASNPHQNLVLDLAVILHAVITGEGRGRVQAGANVSDRRTGWEKNFRDPDIVAVLNDGRAIDCTTHWFGGPDFLVEIRSPGDETDLKIPFYGKILVRELLIVNRDTRHLSLLRHNGQELVPVEPSSYRGGKWLVSEVVPLAFRRKGRQPDGVIEVQRTDGKPGNWTI